MNSMVILHSYVTKFTRGYVEDISKKYVEDLKDIIPMGFSKYIYIRYLDEDMGGPSHPGFQCDLSWSSLTTWMIWDPNHNFGNQTIYSIHIYIYIYTYIHTHTYTYCTYIHTHKH
jgi:hypothetical protein